MTGNDNGGIINVYKPAGMTSFSVVSRIRRLTGIKKVGHCGTLDPFAEGVLPICISRATAAVQFMDQYDKHYTVELIFGKQTDTQDRTGTVIGENEPSAEDILEMKQNDFEALRIAICDLTGTSEQMPPMYSAIKIDGRHLYEYARKGIEIERKTRGITVYDARLVEVSADAGFRATIDIHCSKGTYIRTICEDLGKSLTFGAYANTLIRTACGPFTAEGSITLDKLAGFAGESGIVSLERLREESILQPVEFALSYMDTVKLTRKQALSIIQGQKIDLDIELPLEKPILTFCEDDRFIGITKGREYTAQKTILSAERIFVDVSDYQ
ncbi:MAG: tRNA pseudouridine(55) synthase TruB [Saccharofermentanales bacterium]